LTTFSQFPLDSRTHSCFEPDIYSSGRDLDYVIPFAAISENGRDVTDIDARSELAHRVMLTNTIRLIGSVANKKRALGIITRPAHVLLPLSPNHGQFGSDGLYAESKLGLEALMNKWHSERWADYISLAGAVIGWTRGTNLMAQNNAVAASVEDKHLVRTFSSREMTFNLIALMHPDVVSDSQLNGPIVVDLNGGLHLIHDLNAAMAAIREQIQVDSSRQRVVHSENSIETEIEHGSKTSAQEQPKKVAPRANIGVSFPSLPAMKRLDSIRAKLPKGLLDLSKVIVCVGYGEVGPYGSSRTRWEMEAYSELSLSGCIELSWSMGLIKYQSGDDGWSGWTDSASGERLRDSDIPQRYRATILENVGVRFIHPSLFDGYDPKNKLNLQQIALDADMEPMEVSEQDAIAFVKRHGEEQCESWANKDDASRWFVRLKKGAVIYVPKSSRFSRLVAGQVPTTWDPQVFGIPQEIASQVDKVTLYTLVSAVEAMVAAGVCDPYELYEYLHVSEVGNTIGGGVGGMQAIRDIYRGRLLEKPIQADTLQEMFINTVAAWVNMLLLSSSGPINTPVGACATAIESVELAVEAIQSGRARCVVTGGYDDFGEEGSFEFASMKATSDAEKELSAGRSPKEMSRPATTSRGGFMESHGSGVQVLMSAELAIQMGVPIYGVIALVSTATDKASRSVPAPGQGILTTAREKTNKSSSFSSKLLDPHYRLKQLEREVKSINEWEDEEKELILGDELPELESKDKLDEINQIANLRRKKAQESWSMHFFTGNPEIAPLRGALATFGLTVDDIGVATFHGTGTKANDINESQVLHRQLLHLGRSEGNVCLSIFQKHLTGHPKGAAGAWMLNGLMQAMQSGVVPGNGNADNIDSALEKYDHIAHLNKSLHTYGFEAGILKSFGFGQVGGEVLVIHPDYVLGQLSDSTLAEYASKRTRRYQAASRHWQNAITGKGKFVNVKANPPYSSSDETRVYLDPTARAVYNSTIKSWSFGSPTKAAAEESTQKTSSPAASAPSVPSLRRSSSASALTNLEIAMRELGEGLRQPSDRGIGVDAQLISEIDISLSSSPEFLSRNFSPEEIAYCNASADPIASFAGRWAAKEAVIKALSSSDTGNSSGQQLSSSPGSSSSTPQTGVRNLWAGAGAPLKDIEILAAPSGVPKVHLKGHPAEVASMLGIASINVSITHSGDYAFAQAVARSH
jgi:fatty acid synthase subunit alpha, fungi type